MSACFMWRLCASLFFFFFNDTATTEIYTLSLHDALPISCLLQLFIQLGAVTLIFSLIERHLTKNPDRWDLSGTCGGLRLDLKNGKRSEERRVGKSVDLGGRRIIKKKKG